MKVLEITDDSGFLGVFNPNRYSSFVDEDWDFRQLMSHIVIESQKNNLLLWGTGTEGTWNVGINFDISDLKGYREIEGIIEVTNGVLCLINYESLTMGAQFKDVVLPESHLQNCIFEINNGIYKTRIVQMFNPNEFSSDARVDFIIEFKLIKDGRVSNHWCNIPWFDNN